MDAVFWDLSIEKLFAQQSDDGAANALSFDFLSEKSWNDMEAPHWLWCNINGPEQPTRVKNGPTRYQQKQVSGTKFLSEGIFALFCGVNDNKFAETSMQSQQC